MDVSSSWIRSNFIECACTPYLISGWHMFFTLFPLLHLFRLILSLSYELFFLLHNGYKTFPSLSHSFDLHSFSWISNTFGAFSLNPLMLSWIVPRSSMMSKFARKLKISSNSKKVNDDVRERICKRSCWSFMTNMTTQFAVVAIHPEEDKFQNSISTALSSEVFPRLYFFPFSLSLFCKFLELQYQG